jgi:signal transduction histidine kinase
VRNWSAHAGISARLRANRRAALDLTPDIETTLYRIAQEALTNVAKHAKAEHVDVVLDMRGGCVSLIVEDDGVGFDRDETWVKGCGVGLVGMRERAALVEGTVQVESAAGRGTRVIVHVPLPAVAHAGGSHG